jgi:phosphotransferase system enzyme I (PtsP)
MTLVALGFRRLSMPPSGVGPVRRMVRSLDAGALRAVIEAHWKQPDPSLRQALTAYARHAGVAVSDIV